MGVIVLGMHRSGTSAATAAIAALGVPLGEPADRMPPDADNAEGYHESRALSALNELILLDLGGRWDAPPPLEKGWETTAELAIRRRQAADTFAAVHPTPSWVWKDPRASVLAPLWFDVLGPDHRVVLVFRHPLAVARSLQRRDRFSKAYALALWERTMRLALFSAVGRPTMVVNYTRLMNEPGRPEQWAHELASFVESDIAAGSGANGPSTDPVQAVTAALNVELRHHRRTDGELSNDPEVSAAQRHLYVLLGELEGVHPSFRLPCHLAETGRTEVRLAEHRGCAPDDMDCPHRTVRVEIPWPADGAALQVGSQIETAASL